MERMSDSLWQLAGLTRQPDEVQQRIRSRIGELAQRFRKKDGTYSFPDTVIACVAHLPEQE